MTLKADAFATHEFAASENFHISVAYQNVVRIMYTKAATPVQINIPESTLNELEDLLSEYRRAKHEHFSNLSQIQG